MTTTSWVAALDKKEHKNWVMVGCALNIAKNGIAPLIQGKMEAWYQSLISSPPLQTLLPCTCALSPPKCGTCVTWETELKRHHTSRRPRICWDNSDRNQWGSPTGAWEIAKIFMPTLGSRKTNVIDAETTDIGGLLNLLEWCPFIHPPVSRTVLTSARDQCRNHWAHAPKQELQDADVNTIFGHLNSLLNDPVFSSDKEAQKSSKDLQDLCHHGLVNVRDSEVEALHLLRQSLQADLIKYRDDLDTVSKKVAEVKEQGDLSTEEIAKLRQRLDTEVPYLKEEILTVLNTVEYFNKQLKERDDLQGVCDLREDVEYLKSGIHNIVMELATTKFQVSKLQVDVASLEKQFLELKEEVGMLKAKNSQGQNIDDSDPMCTAPGRLKAFTGRETHLEWLERNLDPHDSHENFPGMSCCTKAICGLGGCGKTSLAVEFAWKCKNHFPGGVFWINVESDENIKISVVESLTLLNISTSTSENVDKTLDSFLFFLSNKKHPWLLVVDNADEFEDQMCPTGVKKIFKGPWQRNGGVPKHGHILLTTRQNVNETTAFLKLSTDDCQQLPCFSEKEGTSFLKERTTVEGEAHDQEAIINLVKELEALPLALEQAAAYISTLPIPCSFKMYLDKYRAVKLRLLEQQPATPLSIEAQYRLSVHTTWLMNFECVQNKSPAAATMMLIAAFLEGDIPFDVINPGLPEMEQVELRESARSELDVNAILKQLSRYSLISVIEEERVFRVHKLVQEVVIDSLTTEMRIKVKEAALRVLNFVIINKFKPLKIMMFADDDDLKPYLHQLVFVMINCVRLRSPPEIDALDLTFKNLSRCLGDVEIDGD